MDRRERYENLHDALLAALTGWQKEFWTALPAIIESFDSATQTCEAQVAIQVPIENSDGSRQWVKIPKLLDVPVHFPSGGGMVLTFPVVKGDECLVVFSSRCIDAWWQSGGYENQQPLLRMHNLSDGFAFVGFRSKPQAISGLSTTSAQLRNSDGTSVVEVKNGEILVKASTVNVQAGTINLKNAGLSLKKLVMDTFITLFNAHVHTSAAAGSPTSPPTIPSTSDVTTVVNAE